MTELIKINYNKEQPTVDARELWKALDLNTDFYHWIKRMIEYGFQEDLDFTTFLSESSGGRRSQEYEVTIHMAKELCMLQRNEKGRYFRQYFISVEEAWNSPEMVVKRANDILNARIKTLQEELTISNENITIMQPKADYFDELVDRNLLLSFRKTAKELKVKEKEFISFLLTKGYIYRDTSGTLMPYSAAKNDGLFEIKEFVSKKNNYKGVQTLVTPRGRETFRLLLKNYEI